MNIRFMESRASQNSRPSAVGATSSGRWCRPERISGLRPSFPVGRTVSRARAAARPVAEVFRTGQTPDLQPRCAQTHHATFLLPRLGAPSQPMLPILPILPKKVAKSVILLGFRHNTPVNPSNPVSHVPAMDPRRFCFVSMYWTSRRRYAWRSWPRRRSAPLLRRSGAARLDLRVYPAASASRAAATRGVALRPGSALPPAGAAPAAGSADELEMDCKKAQHGRVDARIQLLGTKGRQEKCQ
jgi:hypothetical protein